MNKRKEGEQEGKKKRDRDNLKTACLSPDCEETRVTICHLRPALIAWQ